MAMKPIQVQIIRNFQLEVDYCPQTKIVGILAADYQQIIYVGEVQQDKILQEMKYTFNNAEELYEYISKNISNRQTIRLTTQSQLFVQYTAYSQAKQTLEYMVIPLSKYNHLSTPPREKTLYLNHMLKGKYPHLQTINTGDSQTELKSKTTQLGFKDRKEIDFCSSRQTTVLALLLKQSQDLSLTANAIEQLSMELSKIKKAKQIQLVDQRKFDEQMSRVKQEITLDSLQCEMQLKHLESVIYFTKEKAHLALASHKFTRQELDKFQKKISLATTCSTFLGYKYLSWRQTQLKTGSCLFLDQKLFNISFKANRQKQNNEAWLQCIQPIKSTGKIIFSVRRPAYDNDIQGSFIGICQRIVTMEKKFEPTKILVFSPQTGEVWDNKKKRHHKLVRAQKNYYMISVIVDLFSKKMVFYQDNQITLSLNIDESLLLEKLHVTIFLTKEASQLQLI